MYNNLWSRANFNCPKAPKTNLNKELERASNQLDDEGRKVLIRRKLKYLTEMYENSERPLLPEEYEKKLEALSSRWFRIQFLHIVDTKFRHMTSKFLFFYQNLPLIEDVLDKSPNLKEFVYGPKYKDFKFSELFIEAYAEFNQYHSMQISRAEKNSNIEFDTPWDLMREINNFCLGLEKDERLPLRDPPKVYVLCL